MSVIEWSDTYSLGIKQIDEHHRHLFTLLNTIHEVFVRGQKVEIEQVIAELIDYATYHFAAEERLMSQYSYPRAGEHLKLHAGFIGEVKSLQQEFLDGRKALTLELIVFLKDWLLQHILKSDQEYADAIVPEREKSRSPGLQLDLS